MSSTENPTAENTTALIDSANAAAQQVADAAKTATTQAGDTIEASVERIRELNEQAIQAARAAGQHALDAYQAALESVVGAEQKLAAGSQLDWFTTLVTTQAEFTQRLGGIFLTAARDQLK
jgi:transketolase